MKHCLFLLYTVLFFCFIVFPHDAFSEDDNKTSVDWKKVHSLISQFSDGIEKDNLSHAQRALNKLREELDPTNSASPWDRCNRTTVLNFIEPLEGFILGYSTIKKKEFFDPDVYLKKPHILREDVEALTAGNQAIAKFSKNSKQFREIARAECKKALADPKLLAEEEKRYQSLFPEFDKIASELDLFLKLSTNYAAALGTLNDNFGKWKFVDDEIKFSDTAIQKKYDDILDEIYKSLPED